MRKLPLFLAAIATLVSGLALAATPLAAVLTHDLTEHGADGVTHSTRYQERFVRDDAHVWVERVLPAWAQGVDALRKVRLEQDHNELDIHLAPRLIRPSAAGSASLLLVDPQRRATFSAGAEDYEHLGFSGRWDAEFSLIDPASLRRMKLSSRKSAVPGTRWYEQRSASDYTRVLWDEALQFPLVIETGANDGRYQRRTVAEVERRQPPRPWNSVQGYAAREMSDLGD